MEADEGFASEDVPLIAEPEYIPLPMPEPETSQENAKEPHRIEGKKFVRIGLLVMVVCLVAFCSSFVLCGKRRFVTATELAEAHTLLDALGKGLVTCAKDDGLPVTTSWVPVKLADVSAGKVYTPKEHDWDDPAFECAQFKNKNPQHFQIQWERIRPDHGRVHAYGDLDGNGQVDVVVFAEIRCNEDNLRDCAMGPITP